MIRIRIKIADCKTTTTFFGNLSICSCTDSFRSCTDSQKSRLGNVMHVCRMAMHFLGNDTTLELLPQNGASQFGDGCHRLLQYKSHWGVHSFLQVVSFCKLQSDIFWGQEKRYCKNQYTWLQAKSEFERIKAECECMSLSFNARSFGAGLQTEVSEVPLWISILKLFKNVNDFPSSYKVLVRIAAR